MPKWTRRSLPSGSSYLRVETDKETRNHKSATKDSCYGRGMCEGSASHLAGTLTNCWGLCLQSRLMSQYEFGWYKLDYLIFATTLKMHISILQIWNPRLKEPELPKITQKCGDPTKPKGTWLQSSWPFPCPMPFLQDWEYILHCGSPGTLSG